ncbi:hypothetical protein [Leptospira sp. mild_001]|uniref:hypothetical protein n=1 Tax=Leptospira TaxID=171 RepID=UPI001E30539F|nr:hypothetical protein [Leptospira sp. mild_001]
MKLIDFIRNLNEEQIRLIAKNLEVSDNYPLPIIISRLEQSIKSPKHIELTISLCKPPVLSIFQILLMQNGFSMPFENFKEEVTKRDAELTKLVSSKKLLPHQEHDLYRKVLIEAWRNDLRIDSKEITLLNVLREELRISQIDHYLTAQHEEVIPYWKDSNPFETVVNYLSKNCILFIKDNVIYLPFELVNSIRESIGLIIDSNKFNRLLEQLSNDALAEALEYNKLQVSGTKIEKINRLVENFITPFDVLNRLTLEDLKGVADSVGCKKVGTKDELAARLVSYFHNDKDIHSELVEPEIVKVEEKRLSEDLFINLFSNFETSKLILLASKTESKRKTGSKLDIIKSLWNLPISEISIIANLSNDDIRSELRKRDMQTLGSKIELTERLISTVLIV